jgi:hypothetical protein
MTEGAAIHKILGHLGLAHFTATDPASTWTAPTGDAGCRTRRVRRPVSTGTGLQV